MPIASRLFGANRTFCVSVSLAKSRLEITPLPGCSSRLILRSLFMPRLATSQEICLSCIDRSFGTERDISDFHLTIDVLHREVARPILFADCLEAPDAATARATAARPFFEDLFTRFCRFRNPSLLALALDYQAVRYADRHGWPPELAARERLVAATDPFWSELPVRKAG
jgi:hypothetical protein